ncbi:GTP cyclohydrolase II RibA [Acinetobacter nosocomialis]|uniref:GTP cyclohydrolase II RibA n=2 Tax=Acinetobacter nosocomialis TaxID=106654 RepID=UPI00057DACE6|nr:GTP cyclohydrolase II RibA [Acinetobacter nosocomialis]AJB48950.1 hypothetical protein RR32_12795 [Acinetobacter nosocomialis]MBR7741428.1 GTP cyclohydrolase II RibA [Acinetobacter nosocomialis]MDO7438519.1 GTP cyclohydrolase II RibA [Acinetobacter nosocomialis]
MKKIIDSKCIPEITIRSKVQITIKNHIPVNFISFNGFNDGLEHFAIQFGKPSTEQIFVRIHSECITGDLFGSTRCDCGAQLNEAIEYLHKRSGYILYLRQEGRGIGLFSKLEAYLLQDTGLDTYEANLALSLPEDSRNYTVAVQMLKALGVNEIHLITNNSNKADALINHGFKIISQVPTGIYCSVSNIKYLKAKVEKHNHTIDLKKINYFLE